MNDKGSKNWVGANDDRSSTAAGTAFLIQADAAHLPLADRSVHCIVTSPPYWSLRSYGTDPMVWGGDAECSHVWQPLTSSSGQPKGHSGFCKPCGAWKGELGLEPTPDLYVQHLVHCAREWWRVLRDDGTLWLNLGDCFYSGKGSCFNPGGGSNSLKSRSKEAGSIPTGRSPPSRMLKPSDAAKLGLKPKDLVGIPWRVAFALQQDGWYLRSDVVWSKTNCLPESVVDRPTRSHEYLFLLTKSRHYFYDAFAVREPSHSSPSDVKKMLEGKARLGGKTIGNEDVLCASSRRTKVGTRRSVGWPDGRNRRSVWVIGTEAYHGAHFATFPRRLVEPCILAGTSKRGCCRTCGTPYQRIVRKVRVSTRPGRSVKFPDDRQSSEVTSSPQPRHAAVLLYGHRDPKRHVSASRTAGWTKICDCTGGEPVPCVVCDPFAGSGTTVAEPVRLGRIGIGIDLKRAYLELARERVSKATGAEPRLLMQGQARNTVGGEIASLDLIFPAVHGLNAQERSR